MDRSRSFALANYIINSLSELIKEKRKKAHLTQKEFAEQTRVPLSMVRKIEQGKATWDLKKVIHVLQIVDPILNPKKGEESGFKEEISEMKEESDP